MTIGIIFTAALTLLILAKKKQKQPETLEDYNKEIERILGASPKGYNLDKQMSAEKLKALQRLNDIKAKKEEERRAAEFQANKKAVIARKQEAYKNRRTL